MKIQPPVIKVMFVYLKLGMDKNELIFQPCGSFLFPRISVGIHLNHWNILIIVVLRLANYACALLFTKLYLQIKIHHSYQ